MIRAAGIFTSSARILTVVCQLARTPEGTSRSSNSGYLEAMFALIIQFPVNRKPYIQEGINSIGEIFGVGVDSPIQSCREGRRIPELPGRCGDYLMGFKVFLIE
jgi:hypothetical protein